MTLLIESPIKKVYIHLFFIFFFHHRQRESGVITIYFKGFYFIYYIYVAVTSYLNIYLHETGISTTQLGLMISIARGLSIIILPFWGIMADYFSANKTVLQIALLGVTVSLLSFLTTDLFWLVFLLYILFILFEGPIVSLTDALLLSNLESKSNEYGKYRVWGSLSYMIFVTPFGFIIEKTTTRNIFIIAATVLFIALLNSYKLPETKRSIRVSSFSDFKLLLRNKELLYFLVFTFFIQAPLMAHFNYFPILFKAQGGGETLYGLALLIGAASELIIFQKSDYILKKYKFKSTLLISAITFSTRWFLVAVFPRPGVLLLTQLFHSLTYALFHIVAVNYISRIVSNEFKATGQNLYASTIAISTVISSLLGGIIYDNLGSTSLYILGSIISLVAGITYYYLTANREKNISY